MTHVLFSAPLWTIAGWTMLHTLWIGTATGVVAWIVRRCVQSASANVRYAIALCCLAVLALSPLPIAMYVYRAETSAEPPRIKWSTSGALRLESVSLTHPMSEPEITYITRWPDPTSPTSEDSGIESTNDRTWIVANNEADEPTHSAKAKLAPFVAWLPWLWLIGTPTTLFLLATGLLGAERLRRQSHPIEDAPTHELLRRLAASLNIRTRVAIGMCDRFAGPILVGIIRPIILLPPAALLHWSPEQLEMVLLHELSHIRRRDNLVNLLQRLVEALMFFVPSVWFISAWVRLEREHCCDRCVVKNTGKAREYAETLVELAERRRGFRATNESLSKLLISPMAEHQVLTRVRQILKHEDESMKISRMLFGSVLTLVVAIGLSIGWYGIASSAAQDPNAKSPNRADSRDVPDDRLRIDAAIHSGLDFLVAQNAKANTADAPKAENSDEKKASPPPSGGNIKPIDAADAKLESPPARTKAEKPPENHAAESAFAVDPQKYEFTVRFLDDVTLSSNHAGVLSAIKVQRGDSVKKGDELVAFNPDDAQQAEIDFAIAQAKLESAKSVHKQLESMRPKGVVATADIDKASLKLKIAELEMRRQTLKLEGLTKLISAPIPGKIVEVYQRSGKAVKPGDPIVKIANTDRFIVDGAIDVARTPVPKRGDPFTFALQVAALPGGIKTYDFQGKVDYVSSQLLDASAPRPSATLLPMRGIIDNRDDLLRANVTGALQMVYEKGLPAHAFVREKERRNTVLAAVAHALGVSFAGERTSNDDKFAKWFAESRYRAGLEIDRVDPNGPAGKAGMRAGDILVGLGKWETSSFADFSDAVQHSDENHNRKFYILRNGSLLFGNFSFDQEYGTKDKWLDFLLTAPRQQNK